LTLRWKRPDVGTYPRGMSTTPPPTVREATPADADAFAAFFRTAWREAGPGAPGFAGATDDVIDELTTRTAVLDRLGGPDRRMYLAWSSAQVVGFAATRRIDEETVELAGIIVLGRAKGRGVGSRLVEAAIDGARDGGYGRMIVRTETTNDTAQAFYHRCGFSVVGTSVENVDGTAVPVVELAMALD
jgi:ribosomal protein S18 acetylase RimI-like enzyme